MTSCYDVILTSVRCHQHNLPCGRDQRWISQSKQWNSITHLFNTETWSQKQPSLFKATLAKECSHDIFCLWRHEILVNIFCAVKFQKLLFITEAKNVIPGRSWLLKSTKYQKYSVTLRLCYPSRICLCSFNLGAFSITRQRWCSREFFILLKIIYSYHAIVWKLWSEMEQQNTENGLFFCWPVITWSACVEYNQNQMDEVCNPNYFTSFTASHWKNKQ